MVLHDEPPNYLLDGKILDINPICHDTLESFCLLTLLLKTTGSDIERDGLQSFECKFVYFNWKIMNRFL